MIYESLIEKFTQHFTSGPYAEEIRQAKEDFFKNAGIFDEESPNFEMKMAQFADWYLFSRRLNSHGTAPVYVDIDLKSIGIAEEEFPLVRNLRSSRNSLFEYMKIKGDDLYVRDLFSDYRLVIRSSPVTIGFRREELFEARLIPHSDSFVFSGAYCFHPPEATRFILREIKKVKKMAETERDRGREQLIARLFRMRHKFDQYLQVHL